MAALCKANTAYVRVCQGRNWLAKPEKSIVTADYYSEEEPKQSNFVVPAGPEDSMPSEELNCREGEGVPPEEWEESTVESEEVERESASEGPHDAESPVQGEQEPPVETPGVRATWL